jgi:hypothetical protein
MIAQRKMVKYLLFSAIIHSEVIMIDSVSSALASKMQTQRDQMNVSMMKQQALGEQAIAQMLMESAKNIERLTASSSGAQGSIIDIYA